MTKRGGVLTPAGLGDEKMPISSSEFVANGRRWHPALMSSRSARREIQRLITLIEAGRLSIEPMVTSKRPLDRINEAFDDMNNGVGLRAVLIP